MKNADHDLIVSRLIALPSAVIYRCWTEAELVARWFAVPPSTVSGVETNVRPGGCSVVTVQEPDGSEKQNLMTYLEVVPDRRLVFTDAYGPNWEPARKPFMTVQLTFENLGGGKTGFVAVVSHWNPEDRQKHLDMGFESRWSQRLDQLVDVAAKQDLSPVQRLTMKLSL